MSNPNRMSHTADPGTAGLHKSFDFSPVAHLALDPDGLITGINPAGTRLFGCSKRSLLKTQLSLLADAGDRPVLQQYLRAMGERLTPGSCEMKMVNSQGTVVSVIVQSKPVRDKTGRYLGSYAAIIDITRQKEREERYRIVADYTYDWEHWIGPGKEMLYISPSCERVTGYSKDEFLADESLLIEIVHPEDRPLVDRHRQDDFERDKPLEIEYRILHRNGTVRWISHACQPVYVGTGTFQGRRSSNRDITARKEIEESLNLQRSLLQVFCDTIQDAIFILDCDGRIQLANPAYLRIVGATADEVLGKTAHEIYGDGETAAQFSESDRLVLQSGQPEVLEEILPSPEGNRVFLTSKAPYRDSSGHIIGTVNISRDITERKRAEEALKNAHDELERRVAERTSELTAMNRQLSEDIRERKRIERVLRKREGQLSRRSNEIDEMNITLRTLLEQRDRDRRDLEMRILANVKELIQPCLEKLKTTRMDDRARTYVSVLESNLGEIVSPFAHRHAGRLLSPMEMQVANYIKEGLRSKEVGELLNLSKVTVDFYRNNIRKKLGLRNTKTGLRSYLVSLT